MARRELHATAWLERINAVMVAAQAAASRARCTAMEGSPLASPSDAITGLERVPWVPWLARLHIAFEGTIRGEGRHLRIKPGRPWLAWLRRERIRRIEVCCDARRDGAPRLLIDGVVVDPNGVHPH
jgi:hypothetical protein